MGLGASLASQFVTDTADTQKLKDLQLAVQMTPYVQHRVEWQVAEPNDERLKTSILITANSDDPEHRKIFRVAMTKMAWDKFNETQIKPRQAIQQVLEEHASVKHAKRPKPTGHNPSTTLGLVITEDELGKYQEENRRKEAAKQEKLAATEANKLKRSKAANTRAAQAQTVLSSYSAGKEWQKHPAPMLLGALRALAGDAWVKENCKKTTKDIVIQALPQFLESVDMEKVKLIGTEPHSDDDESEGSE